MSSFKTHAPCGETPMFSERCSDAPEKQRLCLASHPKHRFHHSTGFQMRFKFLFHLASVLLIHVAQEAPKCVFLVEPLCPILMKASTGCLGENKRHSQGRASEERLSQTTQFMQWLHTHYPSNTGPIHHVKETQVTILGGKTVIQYFP